MSPSSSLAVLPLLLLSSLCFASADLTAAVVLTEEGTAKAEIVLPNTPSPSITFAAELLQSELLHITGATLPIVETPTAGSTHVWIQSADNTTDTEDALQLGTDGIRIFTREGDLYLGGQGTRGPIYAVAELLDGMIGCRYWTEKEIDRPRQASLVIPECAYLYNPPLEYRYPFWTEGFSASWSLFNKANGFEGLNREEFGGKRSHGGVHTFNHLIPPAAYFDSHPEWFSLINGKRSADHTQLCLTNAEMKAELIKNLKSNIADSPGEYVFSVSQNDWFGFCQCPQCQAIDEANGSPSGTMVSFVNDVAEAIEEDFPDVMISTLAYQYTRKPPTVVKPRANVIIQLCSIECSFSVPLTHPRNRAFAEDIIGWSKIADRLYIWDYTTNFRHYFLPHPNLRVLGENLRFFTEHKVHGVFEQGAYTTRCAEFAPLRAWVLARLLWNPTLDDQALIREFCEGYYEAAAPQILEYIRIIHDSALEMDEPAYCLPSYSTDFPFLSFEVLEQAYALFQTAKANSTTPEIRRRVQIAELPVLYAFILRWNQLKEEAGPRAFPFDQTREELAEEFEASAKDLGVTRINEWEEGFGLLKQILARGGPNR
ncbi:MAG: DUF4838 domain-containing protein [Verrucomicrobiota bacterium]|jgi:hypothetical protein|nr:DUF4838 domain-containing protein [Verrucomicrobiota bacterium]